MELQRLYFEVPADAYCMRILSVAMCSQPIVSLNRRVMSGCADARVSARQGIYYPYWVELEAEVRSQGVVHEGHEMSVRDVIEKWGAGERR